MKEVILCKYGEIVLKGGNRATFEAQMARELRARAARYGNFSVSYSQSTVYIVPKDDFADIDGMLESTKHVFGIVAVCRAAVCEDIRKLPHVFVATI